MEQVAHRLESAPEVIPVGPRLALEGVVVASAAVNLTSRCAGARPPDPSETQQQQQPTLIPQTHRKHNNNTNTNTNHGNNNNIAPTESANPPVGPPGVRDSSSPPQTPPLSTPSAVDRPVDRRQRFWKKGGLKGNRDASHSRKIRAGALAPPTLRKGGDSQIPEKKNCITRSLDPSERR